MPNELPQGEGCDIRAAFVDAQLGQVLLNKRVIEVSSGVAGQHCGFTFAGLGASVVTVRNAQLKVQAVEESLLDIKKTVVSLSLDTPEGFEALVALCANCDLFIEDRAPLGWPTGGALSTRLLERHPRLLAVCLSPFGMTGPYADYAAYPLNCYHSGGNAQQIPCDFLRPEDRERAPLQAGGAWGEAEAGTLAAVAALACLLNPERYAGIVIDCSKQEALINVNWTEIARYPNEGRSPSRLAPLATIVGGLLPTLDGHVQIAVREDHQWKALAKLLAHPEWAEDAFLSSRGARTSRGPDISHLLAAETVKFSTQDLHTRGRSLGIPIAAVLNPTQLLADPDLAARDVWEDIDETGLKLPRWDRNVSATAPSGSVDSSVSATPTLAGQGFGGAVDRPLKGLRVLDFGWVAMGPYAGYTLAGLGAEVIHVARPAERHQAGVDTASYNYGFDTLNTGKAWVGIDLKSTTGVELIHALAAKADIVLDNFRPGVTERLGIDFGTLSAVNPRLVMLSASTYGQRSIGGAYVGYAPVFSALSGLAHLTGYPDGPPAEVSHPVDFFAGAVGVLGIISGLHRLAATGNGCHIDLSAREAILWSLSHVVGQIQTGQRDQQRLGNGHPQMAPHGVYRCQGENRWISIAVGSDEEWQCLCACIADANLSRETQFMTMQSRLENRALLDQRVEQWTQDHDMAWIFDRLQTSGVAAFPSVTSEDLWKDGHIKTRQVFNSRKSDGGQRWYAGAPWRYLGHPKSDLQTIQGAAALQAVFSGVLGLSEEHLKRLEAEGVMTSRL